ncbi:prepilin peptidase [Prosthecobacter sp. SYSU 5D2]|uniref:prepilin peptidase n=1 Tax=Prosthecobacter sp. SYSU 5D2 TaxID=3134134 RepID=UPI0031FEFB28
MLRYQILNALLHFLFFFIGAGIGSFLNVVIYRVPRNLSVNNPRRSFCPSCNYPIPWYHNVPILSWLLLRGRCANCKTSISPRYLGVELFTGLMFFAVLMQFGGDWMYIAQWGPQVLCLWVFMSLLIAGTFIDIEHFLLPAEITRNGTIAGVLASLWVPSLQGEDLWWRAGLMSLASAAVGFGGLRLVVELGKLAFGRKKLTFDKPEAWSVTQPDENEPPIVTVGDDKIEWVDLFGMQRPTDRLVINCPSVRVNDQTYGDVTVELFMETMKLRDATGKVDDYNLENVTTLQGTATGVMIPREAMGLGDVHFMMMIGAFVGWKAVLFTIFAGSILGTLVAGFTRLTGRAQWGAKLPFGPYLAAGAALWIFYGPQAMAWYLSKVTGRTEF